MQKIFSAQAQLNPSVERILGSRETVVLYPYAHAVMGKTQVIELFL